MSHATDFPACPGLPALAKITVDNRNFYVAHPVAAIFLGFLNEIVRRGYSLDEGILDDWSYACRDIRDSDETSEHARGCAVDINSVHNPMTHGAVITDMPYWVPLVAKKWGLRWGGTYSRRPDAMHFEWLGTKADAEALLRSLQPNSPVPDDGITPEDGEGAIRFLQVCLVLAGQHIEVDGVFGKATGQAVKNLKRFFNAHRNAGAHVFDVGPEQGWKAGPLFLERLSQWLNFLKAHGAF